VNRADETESSANPKGDCLYTVKIWQQCGGLGVPGNIKNVKPVDGPYTGYCCEEGTTCQSGNKWYYQCRPKEEEEEEKSTPTTTYSPPAETPEVKPEVSTPSYSPPPAKTTETATTYSPPPAKGKPVGACANVLAKWDQCGGKNAPVGITPKAGLWDGYCCETGTMCKDQNHWYSQCL